jgi:hypothetical protein
MRKDGRKSNSRETENKTYTHIPGGGERLMDNIQKYGKGDVLLIRLGDYVNINNPIMGKHGCYAHIIEPFSDQPKNTMNAKYMISDEEITNLVDMGAQIVHEFKIEDYISKNTEG